MLLGVDHLVIAVPDPDAAAADLEVALGVAATGGGRHERAGTFNRLVFLGDTYLELVGIWDRSRASAHPIGAAAVEALEAGSPGPVTWAIATDGARREVAALRAAGSAIGDPLPGERVRADGAVVRWLVAAAPPLGPDRPPFLIEHELAGPEWGEEARQARASFLHPFGGRVRLVGVELAVADPVAVAAEFARTIGLVFRPAAGAEPGAQEARLGDQSVRLVRPEVEPEPGRGPRSWPRPTSTGHAVRVGLRATAGERLLVDLVGVRFARL